MTKKQRKAVIEILLCASDSESTSGIIDPGNGSWEIDYDLRSKIVNEKDAIAYASGCSYEIACLELAQRIADEEWP